MDRMKTFLIYALIIVGFFVISVLLENGLVMSMYKGISGVTDGSYSGANGRFAIENATANASSVTGYMKFDLKNTTGEFVDKCFVKVDLYNKQGLLADTEYIEVNGMQPGDTKLFNIKFRANNIDRYEISVVETPPDKTNIINVLGWEIDLTNVFGLGIDLSNISIFGTKLADLFTWDNVRTTGLSFWDWLIAKVKSVPGWAYFIALFFIV